MAEDVGKKYKGFEVSRGRGFKGITEGEKT
jgi:hypothetical protein